MLEIHSEWVDLFFFQAEDGIRDIGVTGVQTCALPIFDVLVNDAGTGHMSTVLDTDFATWREVLATDLDGAFLCLQRAARRRSEERRVGKECRSRWSPYH